MDFHAERFADYRPYCSGCVVGNISVPGTPISTVYDPLSDQILVGLQGPHGPSSPGTVALVNDRTLQLAGLIPVGDNPDGLAFDPANGDIYVAAGVCCNDGNLTVINATTDSIVANVTVGNSPLGVAIDPSTDTVFAANLYSNNVSVVDGTSGTTRGSYYTGSMAAGMVFDRANSRLYVTNGNSNLVENVTVINASTGKTAASVPVGSIAWGITVDSANGDLYVANAGSNNVSVIDPRTDRAIASVSVGSDPLAIVYDGLLDEVFVLNDGTSSVSVIDPATNSVVGTIPNVFPGRSVGVFAGLTLDERTGELFATGANSVSAILPGGTSSTLLGVQISPVLSSMSYRTSSVLSATPSCTGGSCPSGTTYAWSLSNSLASLSSISSGSATLTAGSISGVVTVFVNATLRGTTVEGSMGPVSISSSAPVLTGVTLTPGSATLAENQTVQLAAAPTCSPSCPPSVTFQWSVSSKVVGKIASSSGSHAVFGSGFSPGTDVVTVNASLNGIVRSASSTITISAPTSKTGASGLAMYEPYILGASGLAAVAIASWFLLTRRRRRRTARSDGRGKRSSDVRAKYVHHRSSKGDQPPISGDRSA